MLAADFVSPGKNNPQSGMYVPGQGWKSPTFEPESCQREQEAANALVELQKIINDAQERQPRFCL